MPDNAHVHLYAVAFHLGEHLGQGLLHPEVQLRKAFPQFFAQRYQDRGLPEDGGVVFVRNVVKERTGGRYLLPGLQRHAQVGLRQGRQVMAALRIEHVVHELDVPPSAVQVHAFLCQRIGQLFEIHAIFVDAGIFQEAFRLGRGQLHGQAVCAEDDGSPAEHQAHFPGLLCCGRHLRESGFPVFHKGRRYARFAFGFARYDR